MKTKLCTGMVGCLFLLGGFVVTSQGFSTTIGAPVNEELASKLYGGHCHGFPGPTTYEAAQAGLLSICNLREGHPVVDDDTPFEWCAAHKDPQTNEWIIDCGIAEAAVKFVNKNNPWQAGGTLKATVVIPCSDTNCNSGYPIGWASCGS
jgi:hypothetical protein